MLSMKTSGMLASPRAMEEENVVEYDEDGVKSRYFLVRQLGEGSAGRVVLGVPIGGGGEVAIKVIDKRPLNPVQIERVLIECRRLKRLQHPHIVPLLECVEDADRFYMVMPFIPGVDLVEHMYGSSELTPPRLTEDLCRVIFHQVFQAVQHMHENDLVHRDIKLQNILFDARRGRAFVCDLGLATHAGEARGQRERAACGTLLYMAPEVVSRGKYVGPEIDVWSLGVSLFAAATGRVPFYNESPTTTIKLIRRGHIEWSQDDTARLSPAFLGLLKRMLTVDAVHRPTLSECLADQWFRPLAPSLPSPPALARRAGSAPSLAEHDSDPLGDDPEAAQRRRLSRILRKFTPRRRKAGSHISAGPASPAPAPFTLDVYVCDLDAVVRVSPPFSEQAVRETLERQLRDKLDARAEEVVLIEDGGEALRERVERGGRARMDARIVPRRAAEADAVRAEMARAWGEAGREQVLQGCVVVVDARSGVVCALSRGAEMALGWKEGELLGRPAGCVFRTEIDGEVRYGESFPMVLVHRNYARMPMWCVLERVDASKEAWRCSPLLVGPTEWHDQFLLPNEEEEDKSDDKRDDDEGRNHKRREADKIRRGDDVELGEDKPRAMVDENGRVVRLNAAAKANARVKVEVGEPVSKLLSPESEKRLAEYLRNARTADGVVKITASMTGMQLSVGDLFELNKGQGSFFMAMLTLRQLALDEGIYFVISFNFF